MLVLLTAALIAQTSPQSTVDVHSNRVDLGKSPATVLVFLSHECPIANDYQPTLRALGTKYKGRAKFVGVYVDPRLTKTDVMEHVAEFRAAYTPVVDHGHRLVKAFAAKVTPEVRVLDPKGKVLYSGRIDDTYPDIGVQRPEPKIHDLDLAIAAVLAGKTPSNRATKAVGCVIPPLSAYSGQSQ